MASLVLAARRAGNRPFTRDEAIEVIDMICAGAAGTEVVLTLERPGSGGAGIADHAGPAPAVRAHPGSDLGHLLRIAFATGTSDIDIVPARYDIDAGPEARDAWIREVVRPFLERCGLEDARWTG